MQKTIKLPLVVSLALSASLAVAQSSQPLPDSPSTRVAPPPATKPAEQPKPAPAQENKAPEPIFKSLEAKKQPSGQSTPAQKPEDLAPPADSDISQQKPAEPQSLGGPSQQTPAEELGPESTIVRQVNEVNLVFTVTDKRGRYIKDLKREDFAVYDDKKPAEAIRNFAAQTDLPLRVGLLIDASSSIRQQFKFEQEAAIEFLNQVVNYKKDLAFTVGFDATPEVTQEMTNSMEQLSKGIRMIRPGGGTALYDAVFYSCRDKLMKHRDRETVRRAIILLTDGVDNQSRVTREEAIEMCQRAETIIYTISTDTSSHKTDGDKVLDRMADATGGRSFSPYKIEDVANAFEDIKDELRSQYSIAYKPADFAADGRFRSVEIQTPNKKLRVRTRKGYFAPRSQTTAQK